MLAAATSHTLSEARTSGAPQQQVVNGWYTNELAVIHAEQLAETASRTARIAAVLGVLALTIIGDLAIRALPPAWRS